MKEGSFQFTEMEILFVVPKFYLQSFEYQVIHKNKFQ